jgi:hypothetical protein
VQIPIRAFTPLAEMTGLTGQAVEEQFSVLSTLAAVSRLNGQPLGFARFLVLRVQGPLHPSAESLRLLVSCNSHKRVPAADRTPSGFAVSSCIRSCPLKEQMGRDKLVKRILHTQ